MHIIHITSHIQLVELWSIYLRIPTVSYGNILRRHQPLLSATPELLGDAGDVSGFVGSQAEHVARWALHSETCRSRIKNCDTDNACMIYSFTEMKSNGQSITACQTVPPGFTVAGVGTETLVPK